MRPPTPLERELVANAAFVRSLAGALLLDATSADDLAQETYLTALRSPPRKPGPLRPWLVGVVRNLARRHRRSAARRTQREHAAAVPERREFAIASAERAETAAALGRAVSELSEPYRTVIVLRFLEGLPVTQVASRTEVPLETARTRLRRALVMLRDSLGAAATRDRRLMALLPWPGPKSMAPHTALVAKGGLIVGSATKYVAAAVAAGLLVWVGVRWASDTAIPSESPAPAELASTTGERAPVSAPPGLAGQQDARPAQDGAPRATPTPPDDSIPAPVRPPSRVRALKGRISGTARLPEGASAADWIVIWRHPMWTHGAGACDLAAAGTFACDVPSGTESYRLWLRKRTSLWPTTRQPGITAGGLASGVSLEPDALPSFRISVVGDPPTDGLVPLQIKLLDGFQGTPNLRRTLAANQSEIEVDGLDPGILYNVYVGPTGEGRFGHWQGRPAAGELVTIDLTYGGALRGSVEGPSDLDPKSVRVRLYGFVGVELEAPVDEAGRFDQKGLLTNCLWKVTATGRRHTGESLAGETKPVLPGPDLVLTLTDAPR